MLVTALWMALLPSGAALCWSRGCTNILSWLSLRETEDKTVITTYQTVLEGRKELTLNRERAEYVLTSSTSRTPEYRHHLFAPIPSTSSAVNWSSSL